MKGASTDRSTPGAGSLGSTPGSYAGLIGAEPSPEAVNSPAAPAVTVTDTVAVPVTPLGRTTGNCSVGNPPPGGMSRLMVQLARPRPGASARPAH